MILQEWEDEECARDMYDAGHVAILDGDDDEQHIDFLNRTIGLKSLKNLVFRPDIRVPLRTYSNDAAAASSLAPVQEGLLSNAKESESSELSGSSKDSLLSHGNIFTGRKVSRDLLGEVNESTPLTKPSIPLRTIPSGDADSLTDLPRQDTLTEPSIPLKTIPSGDDDSSEDFPRQDMARWAKNIFGKRRLKQKGYPT
jgi:hypothetical protein